MTSSRPRLTILLPLLFALSPRQGAAWCPVGHQVVAQIAEDNLTDAAKQGIQGLLGQGVHLKDVANWADETASDRHKTEPLHAIKLPVSKNVTIDQVMNYCPDGNCVVAQVDLDIQTLRDPKADYPKKIKALKYLVHLTGDLHQPLHCSDNSSQDGNQGMVLFHNVSLNLYAVWDDLIEDYALLKYDSDRALQLEKKITPENKKEWEKGAPKDWAYESYLIAKIKIYKVMTPKDLGADNQPLPENYYSTMRPIVNKQLEKAGIRLAYVLNQIFSPKALRNRNEK